MIIFALTAVLILTAAAATFALFYAVKHAPDGYEDDSGFHEGVELKPVVKQEPKNPKNKFIIRERPEPRPTKAMAATGRYHADKASSDWAA